MAPTYNDLYITEYVIRCPILQYALQNTGNGVLNDARVVLTNPNSVASAQLRIDIDTAFTMNVRLRGYTDYQNIHLNLQIRVCGAETYTLVNSATKFYIHGLETGDIPSMLDATRYQTINWATIQSWFSLSPSNDVCTRNFYGLFSSPSSTAIWNQVSDPQILFTGSLAGGYTLKMDKTVATNTKTFWIGSWTRGLVASYQKMELTICPRTGGVTVTPPTPYSPLTPDVTEGLVLNLATDSLFQLVDYYGGAQSVDWGTWAIADLY